MEFTRVEFTGVEFDRSGIYQVEYAWVIFTGWNVPVTIKIRKRNHTNRRS